jgi:hypothetical protein
VEQQDHPATGPLRRERRKRLALDTANESGLPLQSPTPEEAMKAILNRDLFEPEDLTIDRAPRLDRDLGPDLGM